MSGKIERSGLGSRCVRCRAPCVVFGDHGAEAKAPLTGLFSFRCEHCGADNQTTAEDLVRLSTSSARDHAA